MTTFGASFLVPVLNGFVSPIIFATIGAVMLGMVLISIYVLKKGPIGVLAAVISLPVLGLVIGLPLGAKLGLLGMLVIFVIRRLTAPQPVKAESMSKIRATVNRILYDREISDKQVWLSLLREKEKRNSMTSHPLRE